MASFKVTYSFCVFFVRRVFLPPLAFQQLSFLNIEELKNSDANAALFS